MPIYEYRCPHCESSVEVLERMGSKKKHACPKCGGKLEKLFSAFGVSKGLGAASGSGAGPCKPNC